MAAGISRIVITNGNKSRGAYRFKQAAEMQPAANDLYRLVFGKLRCPLLSEYEEVLCERDDIMSAYDRLLGVDVILRLENGMPGTIQEKFLKTTYDTVTVEYYNNPHTNSEGDWFHMKAQYYFVGYYYPDEQEFYKWALLDWAMVVRETSRGNMRWQIRRNQRDGAMANFQWIYFNQIPECCIVAAKWEDINYCEAYNGGWGSNKT